VKSLGPGLPDQLLAGRRRASLLATVRPQKFTIKVEQTASIGQQFQGELKGSCEFLARPSTMAKMGAVLRMRAALRVWRLVLTCLVVALLAPSAPSERVEDAIAWVATARGAASASDAVELASRRALADARVSGSAALRSSAPCPATGAWPRDRVPIYLANCSLLR